MKVQSYFNKFFGIENKWKKIEEHKVPKHIRERLRNLTRPPHHTSKLADNNYIYKLEEGYGGDDVDGLEWWYRKLK